MYQTMKIFGFAVDPLANRPMVLLKAEEGDATVPLWISMMEAVAMAAELVGREIASQSGRGDLLMVLMERLGMRITAIGLDSIRDGLVAASVLFSNGSEELRAEVRACEALIASLKFKLSLQVSDEVIAWAATHVEGDETGVRETEARRFIDFLEQLDPATLGKYPM
jgi:bifunctional DNase/RNase